MAFRPFPVAPLARRCGLDPATDPTWPGRLALQLRVDRSTVWRAARDGLTERQADDWSARAGLHLMTVWPEWGRGLAGVALVAALRERCRCGRPYDKIDNRGKRYCSACLRARVARCRAKRLANRVVTTQSVA